MTDQTAATDARDVPMSTRQLPTMDLARYLRGEPGALDALAEDWRKACEELGFLCIVNHGLSDALLERMEGEARRFHALPEEEKLKIRVNEHQRGFIPSKATIVKHSTYETHTKLDTVQCLVVATDYPEDDSNLLAGKQFYARNRWPENLPGFQEAVETYMREVDALGKRLLPVWAASLELEPGFFEPYFTNSYNYFRIAKYPRTEFVEEREFGLGAHADTGFMTFLPPAREPGLQVLAADNTWFWPEVPPGAIIVNIGQFLSRWTNDRFRATPHRVLPPRDNDRYSFACFINTNLDAEVECLPTCTGPDNPPKYPRQSYWEFFQWYMSNTYTHYGKVGADEAAE